MQFRIKDQILSRREALGLTRKELADRVGVTEQAVRYWEDGRSFPGKSKSRLVEQALSFTLDWTEGASAPAGGGKSASAMIDQNDIDLLLVLARLPAQAKGLIGDFARMHLEVVEKSRRRGEDDVDAAPPPPTPPAIKKSPARHR